MGMESNIKRAVEMVGGPSAFARELGVSRQTVRTWMLNGIAPAKWVDAIETVTTNRVAAWLASGPVTAQSLLNDIVEWHRRKGGGDER